MTKIIPSIVLTVILGIAAVFAQDPPEPLRSTLAFVNFEGSGGMTPTPPSVVTLDSLAPTLKRFPDRLYELHAYFCPADDAATSGTSAARAASERMKAIGNYLVANGVPTGNIAAVKAGYADVGSCARVAIVAVDAQPAPAPTPEPIAMTDFRPKSEPEPKPASIAEPEPEPEPPMELIPADPQGRPTLAIYMAGEEPQAAKGSHYILGSELARTISESDKYLAVDRTEDIQAQIAKEHIYQRDGAVADDQIMTLGLQLGARYLCIGNIKDVGKRSYYLDVRLVDVVTAEIKRTVTASSNLKDANEKTRIAREIAFELIETDKARAARKRKKTITLATAISLDVLGVGALMYGFIENNNVVKQKELPDYPEADRAATRRNVGYIVGAAVIASGVTVHILF